MSALRQRSEQTHRSPRSTECHYCITEAARVDAECRAVTREHYEALLAEALSDPDTYNYVRKLTRDAYECADATTYATRAQNAAWSLAEMLEDDAGAYAQDDESRRALLNPDAPASLFSDLLSSALGLVDFLEIAHSLVSEVCLQDNAVVVAASARPGGRDVAALLLRRTGAERLPALSLQATSQAPKVQAPMVQAPMVRALRALQAPKERAL